MSRKIGCTLAGAAALAVLVPAVAGCTDVSARRGLFDRLVVADGQCQESAPAIPYDERHPDQELRIWADAAEELPNPGRCAHDSADLNLLVIGASDFYGHTGVGFAIDFDNGFLYNAYRVSVFSHRNLFHPEEALEPDAVLSPEELDQLRDAIDRYHVLEWPDRKPGEKIGETCGAFFQDGFELAAIFYDDTGVYVERPEKSDDDVVAFVHFARDFLANYIDDYADLDADDDLDTDADG